IQLAYQYGLRKKTLELLRQPHTIAPENQALEADMLSLLLLFTGQVEELTDGLSTAQPFLGPKYEWYSALLGAATGNYQRAGESLDAMIAAQESQLGNTAVRLMRGLTLQGGMEWRSLLILGILSDQAQDLSGLRTLRGVVALEQGDTAAAAR